VSLSLQLRLTTETRTSTVLQGARDFISHVHEGTNSLTTLLETSDQYIVLQQKGEAVEHPVIPASRSIGTILYEVEPGQDNPIYELFATSENLSLKVSDEHYQVAELDDRQRLMAEKKLWSIGKIEIKMPPPDLSLDRTYLVLAVRIRLQQNSQAAQGEAILLAPNEEACRRAGADVKDFRTWKITESMTIDLIRESAETGLFEVVFEMPRTWFSLDMDNVENETIFISEQDLQSRIAEDTGEASTLHRLFDTQENPHPETEHMPGDPDPQSGGVAEAQVQEQETARDTVADA
jgi:hypothetical protein